MIVELSKIYSSEPIKFYEVLHSEDSYEVRCVVGIDPGDGFIDSYIEIMNIKVDRSGWKRKTFQAITFYQFSLFKPDVCYIRSPDERAKNIVFCVNARYYLLRHYTLSEVRLHELYWRA